LNCGTTTASYFATIHKAAAEILADIVELSGQRAFIGKVNMDCYSPDNYCETTAGSLKATEDFILNINKRKVKRMNFYDFIFSVTLGFIIFF
jgi:guanine deaminase